MAGGKRNENPAGRKTADRGRTPRASGPSRASSTRNRREDASSESSDARSRSRSQSDGQQQPSAQRASPDPAPAPRTPDQRGGQQQPSAQSASTPAPPAAAAAAAAPTAAYGPNAGQAPPGATPRRHPMVILSDVMIMLAHYDEIEQAMNNPAQGALTDECLAAMGRLSADFPGLLNVALRDPPPSMANGPGAAARAPRRPMAMLNDFMILIAHFDEIMDAMTNPAQAAMSQECLAVFARIFDDSPGLLPLLRYVIGCLDRLATAPGQSPPF